jgi:hypothetical protein
MNMEEYNNKIIARGSADANSVHQSKTLHVRHFFLKMKTLPTHTTAIAPYQPREGHTKTEHHTVI